MAYGFSVKTDVRPAVATRASLLSGLAYFDVFDHPLTLEEIRRFRWHGGEGAGAGVSLGEARAALDGDPSVAVRDGYYHFRGRESVVDDRKRRSRAAISKIARASAAARAIGALPQVRLVAVCNSLAFMHAEEESDIDLFVVVRPGHLWSTRFAVAGALAALGMRPEGENHADRFCMSFFAAEDALDLSRFAIGDDPYLRYWTATLLPLYDAGGAHARFLRENRWVLDRIPGAFGIDGAVSSVRPDGAMTRLALAASAAAEPHARRYQERRFPAAMRSLLNRDTRVVADDRVLKFHVDDRREAYADRFSRRLVELGLE